LSLIHDALPEETRGRLVLVPDRGFDPSHFHSEAGFCRLLASKVRFIMRLPRRVLLHVAHPDFCLETLAAALKPGDCVFVREVDCGRARARLNACAKGNHFR
jgi:hypothetical protein